MSVLYRVKTPKVEGLKPGQVMSPFTTALGESAGLGQSYDAAGHGRRAKTWRVSAAGPNASLTWSLPVLRNRSRDAVRKNPYAESIVSTLEVNVVGTGIKPQWQTSDAGLNRELAALWLEWTDEADADARLDWYGMEALATRATAEAGEVFARLRVRRPGDMDTVPLQIQLLESEFCPIEENRSERGREIRNGVEFDMVGRRTAYWMYFQHPNDWNVNGIRDARPHPVPASEVLHVANPKRPGQIRGEPWLARALIKLRDLDAYDDAELMRKKTAAMFAAFITRDGDGAFMGEDDPDDEGVALTGLEPGTMQVLGINEDVTFSSPADVGGSYEPFMRQQLRGIAVAAGTLYEQLTGDYSNVNDRTYRASVNEFRRRIGMLQHHLIVYQLCRPVVRRWTDLGLISGQITLPAGMDERELRHVEWIPQGWSYIHPVQEVQAAKEAVRGGFKSRAQVVSEQGYDSQDIDRENADDNRRADELGLLYDSDGRQPRSGGSGNADSEERAEREESEMQNA